MASLIDRVTRFARGPQGQSMIRKAMNRFGGGPAKGGRRGAGGRWSGAGRRGGAGRRTGAGRRARRSRRP
jgi:hypothetical protein